MKKDDNITDNDLQKFAQALHKIGSGPALSRRQKKAMLKSILPPKPLVFRLVPAFSAAFLTGILLVGSLSFASQPGDALYSIKRGLEDVRSSIQPSYDKKLLQKRNDEIEDLNKSGSDDNKLDIANKEKQEIEKRLKSEDSEDHTESEQHDSTDETHIEDNEQETEVHRSQESSTPASTQQLSAKDQCKAALDARKRAGEAINSDQYKACDKL